MVMILASTSSVATDVAPASPPGGSLSLRRFCVWKSDDDLGPSEGGSHAVSVTGEYPIEPSALPVSACARRLLWEGGKRLCKPLVPTAPHPSRAVARATFPRGRPCSEGPTPYFLGKANFSPHRGDFYLLFSLHFSLFPKKRRTRLRVPTFFLIQSPYPMGFWLCQRQESPAHIRRRSFFGGQPGISPTLGGVGMAGSDVAGPAAQRPHQGDPSRC